MKHFILLTFAIFVFAFNVSASNVLSHCSGGELGYDTSIYIYGYSEILYDDNSPQRVSGIAGTELYIFGYPNLNCEDWDPWIHSSLYRTDDPENVYSEGTIIGYLSTRQQKGVC